MSETYENLADSIAMLEQILEVMPQDIDALKTLYNANLQSGLADKAFDYLGRLVDVAASNGDPDLFAYLQYELPRFEESHSSEAAAQQSRLKTLMGVHKINEGIIRDRKALADERERSRGAAGDIDVTEELTLAWRLYEEDQLSQEEYSAVLHDLTEISQKDLEVPATVLHVLSDRGFLNVSRILAYMAERSGSPFIKLTNFELPEDAGDLLPIAYAAREGAIAFGTVGDCLQVAVLNPFNGKLLDRIEKECGRKCHSFLVEAADYDHTLEKLRSYEKAAD
ncbi:hypothetical protein P9H32_12210 [Pontiella sp. NLcol2]|uniref:Type II secretion system protein GspE N-terminal domain-containing protein n=2 Tax=Pontiella agarivorans TaxID=3038953 RepID=A0ABU5MZ53_9BACT|nr:hypothetical protein [Pontiella agarivorans]